MGRGRRPYTSKQKREQSERMKAKWANSKYRKSQQEAMKNGNTGGHNKGKKMSVESKEKMRQAKLKNPTKYWLGKTRYDMSGKNHPLWKGGITPCEKLERTRFQQTIQKRVFERDKYTCQICGQVGGNLQVDHIQSWADYVELRFDMDNCRTLCMACHYKLTFGKEMPQEVLSWGHNLSMVIRN